MTVDSRPDDMLVRPESKGLHTVSSYIPMLQPGTRYQISIHSWKKPEMTAGDPQSMIEARIFVNGAPVTLESFLCHWLA